MAITPAQSQAAETIALPAPKTEGSIAVERALHLRRSVRSFNGASLSFDDLAQILWAAQGVTEPGQGLRTAPSAGALYPLELYVAAGSVKGLKSGLYRYIPDARALEKIQGGDKRPALAKATLGPQLWIEDAPVILVFTGDYNRTARKYGMRAGRYVHIEAGHAAQNVYLQAETCGLGTAIVGAFDDAKIKAILNAGKGETPLAIMPVGYPAEE